MLRIIDLDGEIFVSSLCLLFPYNTTESNVLIKKLCISTYSIRHESLDFANHDLRRLLSMWNVESNSSAFPYSCSFDKCFTHFNCK